LTDTVVCARAPHHPKAAVIDIAAATIAAALEHDPRFFDTKAKIGRSGADLKNAVLMIDTTFVLCARSTFSVLWAQHFLERRRVESVRIAAAMEGRGRRRPDT